MPGLLPTPRFKDETEEADWWFCNRDLIFQMFLDAEQDGTLRCGPLVHPPHLTNVTPVS